MKEGKEKKSKGEIIKREMGVGPWKAGKKNWTSNRYEIDFSFTFQSGNRDPFRELEYGRENCMGGPYRVLQLLRRLKEAEQRINSNNKQQPGSVDPLKWSCEVNR